MSDDWRTRAPNATPAQFFYATNEGHSWQCYRNPRWLFWIETGVTP